jgi:hypothetical protein
MQPHKSYGDSGLVGLLFRAVVAGILLAGLAALAAGLFGALCGLVFWARYGEAGILAIMTARCALAGAGAGALVGTLGRLLDGARMQAGARPLQPPARTSSRNGYCRSGAALLSNGTLRHHPHPDWGGRRLRD